MEEHFSISCSRVLHASGPGGIAPDCPLNSADTGVDVAKIHRRLLSRQAFSLQRGTPLELPTIPRLLAHLLNFRVPQAIVSAFYVYIPSSLNLCLAKMRAGKLIHSFMSR